ncbi:hypothetical protein A2853_03050 [Candidatus Kaiserbacteria bacterium RIFCSPHIGHO2_01_FULL_55_17]|uniref:Bacterial Ig domain-containing protein n=1 Tax=Candidatus Kaiserbacteria bacterium RIFCSPHIGHO2_01_FULL_55_17 TaxID=1798484 RepID=A0A1F6D931_9BACT|nr:MAG: hypothetical protein A2853_03050 [Candidatus Kaiserbacteria bacterium RIFCSPHIGHO2_01_FULL_55_17]
MLPYQDSRVTKIVLVVFFVLVIGYAYFEIRGLLWGPVIEIETSLVEVSEPFVTVEGYARRIATLSMNGKIIPVTEEGAFSEGYVLAPGYNRIVLEARDRYGNTTERSIEMMFMPTSTPSGARQ